MPFHFWGLHVTSKFVRLVGLSFFPAATNVVGFPLASPHVQNNRNNAFSEGKPCNFILIQDVKLFSALEGDDVGEEEGGGRGGGGKGEFKLAGWRGDHSGQE